MTRHGMVQPSAAGAQPPAANPRAPMVIIDADRAAIRPRIGPTTPRGRHNEAVRPHPPLRFPTAVAPSPTPAENPKSP